MNKTKIEYLTHTWNVTCGCSGIDCAVRKVCWAMAQSKRDMWRCSLCYKFIPHLHEERLYEPLHRKKPSRIGVSFKGDFYDTNLSYVLREKVLNVVNICRQHMFFFLTKQPQNILPSVGLLTNAWFGVTVNRKEDLWRIDKLREVPAHRWVSFEPLYENIDADLTDVEWIVIGAQTNPSLQPKPEWVESLIQCARIFGAKVWLKNNLYPQPTVKRTQEFPQVMEK